MLGLRDAGNTLFEGDTDDGIAFDDGRLDVVLLSAPVGNVLTIVGDAVYLPPFFLDDAAAVGLVDVYCETHTPHLVLHDVEVGTGNVPKHPEYFLGLDPADGQLVVHDVLAQIVYAAGVS